jgi:hypothetical protein
VEVEAVDCCFGKVLLIRAVLNELSGGYVVSAKESHRHRRLQIEFAAMWRPGLLTPDKVFPTGVLNLKLYFNVVGVEWSTVLYLHRYHGNKPHVLEL